MARVFPIQTSFIGGKISKNVQGNTDSDLYANSVDVMDNFIPTPQGSARFRAGTVHAGEGANPNGARLVPFNTAYGNFCVEIGADLIKVWQRNGNSLDPVSDDLSANKIVDPQFNDPDNSGWAVKGAKVPSSTSVPVYTFLGQQTSIYRYNLADPAYETDGTNTGGYLHAFGELAPYHPQFPFIENPNGTFLSRVDSLNRVPYPVTEDINIEAASVPPGYTPPEDWVSWLILEHTVSAEDAGKDFVFKFKNWLEGCIGYIPSGGGTYNYLDGKDGNIKQDFGVGELNGLFTVRFSAVDPQSDDLGARYLNVPNGTSQGDILELETTPVTLPAGLVYISIDFQMEITEDINDNRLWRSHWRTWTYDPELRIQGSGDDIEFGSPFNQQQLDALMWDVEPSEAMLVLTHPDAGTFYLFHDGDAWLWDTITNAPPGEPDVSPPNYGLGGYPAACTFHEGRLYLGGGRNFGSSISASAVGEYWNFKSPNNGANDEGLYWEVIFKGFVRWLDSNSDLLIGNDSNEHFASSEQGGPITYDNFDFRFNSNWGSWPVQPLGIDRQTLFVQVGGKAIRALKDEGDTANVRVVEEVSILANDLFVAGGVNQLSWGPVPDYQMLIRSGSNIVACTYMPVNAVKAFYQISGSGGTGQVNSIASVDDINGTTFWISVQRDGTHYIEFYSEANFAGRFLDANTNGQLTASDTITGLGHFADGTEITVLITQNDGTFVIEENVAVAAGSATLSQAYTGTYVAGLPYTGRIKTLKPEGSNPSGSSQVDKRRFSEIELRMVNGVMPVVNGQVFNVAQQLEDDSDKVDDPNAILTGDYVISLEGYTDGVLEIIQDKPLACEIAAIFGTMRSSRR